MGCYKVGNEKVDKYPQNYILEITIKEVNIECQRSNT